MSECVVIADDLTGGNATGVLLKKMKYKAHTVINLAAIEPSQLAECDCVIYPCLLYTSCPPSSIRSVS